MHGVIYSWSLLSLPHGITEACSRGVCCRCSTRRGRAFQVSPAAVHHSRATGSVIVHSGCQVIMIARALTAADRRQRARLSRGLQHWHRPAAFKVEVAGHWHMRAALRHAAAAWASPGRRRPEVCQLESAVRLGANVKGDAAEQTVRAEARAGRAGAARASSSQRRVSGSDGPRRRLLPGDGLRQPFFGTRKKASRTP